MTYTEEFVLSLIKMFYPFYVNYLEVKHILWMNFSVQCVEFNQNCLKNIEFKRQYSILGLNEQNSMTNTVLC